MSTYYYLVCDKCCEIVDAASRTAGGVGCHLCNSDTCLPPFIVKHSSCGPLRVVNEYELDGDSNEPAMSYTRFGLTQINEELCKRGLPERTTL